MHQLQKKKGKIDFYKNEEKRNKCVQIDSLYDILHSFTSC